MAVYEISPPSHRSAAEGVTVAPLRPSTMEPLWRHLLGARLRRLRHARGERLEDTARRAGVSPQYLSEMERGIKDPSSEIVAAVASALDVTLLGLTVSIARELHAASSAPRTETAAGGVRRATSLRSVAPRSAATSAPRHEGMLALAA